MSPGKPAGNIKIAVPRHNAHRIGGKLIAEASAIASIQGLKVDLYQPNYEPANGLAQAIESASEWNSLLMTARAERGPQWDVNTQQFLVDEGSDLFYDPTVLLECQKKVEEENASTDANRDANRDTVQPHEFFMSDPLAPPNHRGVHPHNNFAYGAISSSPAHARHAPVGTPFNGTAFNSAISPSQFYGMHGSEMGTPVRMGVNMDGHGMNLSPDMRRRVTRGIDEGYPGMHIN